MRRYSFIFMILFSITSFADVQDDLFNAAHSGSVDAMQEAFSSGAGVNDENILGETALMYAIDECRTEAAKVLIDKGAKLDYLTKLNYTPLMKAAAEGCLEIVQLLVAENVNIDRAEPKKNHNPLIKATIFNRLPVVDLLVNSGAEVDFRDKYGNTPLMIASQHDYVDIAEFLIDKGADVNAASMIGYTPLLYALELGRPEIAEILIDHGASVTAVDKYNNTTLMFAASRGYSELVEVLVAKGVDLNAKTKKDESAAVLAQKHEYEDIVEFLLQNGADSTGLVFVDSAAVALEAEIAEMYDTPPEPIGGTDAIQKKLRYPKDAEDAGLTGTVTVKVTVDKRGRVRDTEIVDSFGDDECEKAAQRAIRGVRWQAAEKEGKRVEAWIDIPVEFTLEN